MSQSCDADSAKSAVAILWSWQASADLSAAGPQKLMHTMEATGVPTKVRTTRSAGARIIT
jgi:hypothetical protein